MSKIVVTSLRNHRINNRTADLLAEVLAFNGMEVTRKLTDLNVKEDILFVTNGMAVVDGGEKLESLPAFKAMMECKKVYYFKDEIRAWTPTKQLYPHIKLVSQFYGETDVRFPISELHYLGKSPINTGEFDYVYWGHYKIERYEEYKKFIPVSSSTLIISDKEEWPDAFRECTFVPYIRDMDELYRGIARGTRTTVFGDELTNGINIPSRLYEGLKCGLTVVVDDNLVGNQGINYEPTMSSIFMNLCLVVDFADSIFGYNIGEEIVYEGESKAGLAKPNTQLAHSTTDASEVLKARGMIYGSYRQGVECRAKILEALNDKHLETQGKPLPEDLRIMFSDLALKLMRLASDPTHLDSYVDLEGYAKLIKEQRIG